MSFRFAVTAAVFVCLGFAADKPLTEDQRRLNIESFEHVWTTVRDRHWDPKINGVNWQAVHDELRPKVEKAKTMDEARGVMSDMLSRLHETHFGIAPADLYDDLGSDNAEPGKEKPSREGNPGITLRVIDGHALVTEVDSDSPAAHEGVKPGWEIVKADGTPISPRLKKIQSKFATSTLLDIFSERSVDSLITGPSGSNVKVTFIDGANKPVDLTLARVKPRGVTAIFGNLPPMNFWVEAKKVQPDIGMVRFNIFFQPDQLIKSVQDMVGACRECKGMIIDLRGNPGGMGALAMGLAGWFTEKSGQQLGTMITRDTKLNFVIFPRPEPFRGPLAVLVDGCSGSTSEIFAGGMKDIGRARIFGTRTAGAALPSVFERLPNGDGFQYAIANYVSSGGKQLEGAGVIPDEQVKLTRQALLAGHDPALEAAVAWIETQKK